MNEKKEAVQAGRPYTANQDNDAKSTVIIVRLKRHIVKWDTTILREFFGGCLCVAFFFLAMYIVLKVKGVL